MAKIKVYWEFARPFTLLAPAIGMISGGITAFGAQGGMEYASWMFWNILAGSAAAAALNSASNGLNQIFDVEIDKINKPGRPLPSGRLSLDRAWDFVIVFAAAAVVAAWFIIPAGGGHPFFLMVMIAAAMTYAYSAPPMRTKRFGIIANLTIAIPRGVLLKVAGWSAVRPIDTPEPWYIGAIFGLFLLGATTSKDYADIEGDREAGCRTLPIRYGVKRSACMIAPFFVLPFLLMPLGVWTGMLTGNSVVLSVLGALLALWGVYVCYLILRDPDALAGSENHISWTHMYLMMMAAQVGFAVAYLA